MRDLVVKSVTTKSKGRFLIFIRNDIRVELPHFDSSSMLINSLLKMYLVNFAIGSDLRGFLV